MLFEKLAEPTPVGTPTVNMGGLRHRQDILRRHLGLDVMARGTDVPPASRQLIYSAPDFFTNF